mgnify:CR=1 FL=1
MPNNNNSQHPDAIDPISLGPLIKLDNPEDIAGLAGAGLGNLIKLGKPFIKKAIGKVTAKKIAKKIIFTPKIKTR